ncbi:MULTISPECIES: hypothetical protein [unclassified Pseudonocardia]|uniref:hypothetical protein n=1 Tax=unclassified Pseudonocardia TaxID=2619320 RepID=UPI001AC751DA|nr:MULTISPECIES: hypothetical protein [unclassified Pseudonocardia]MBN9096776.1 hypothetical protein [Pseudonocardia sp.]
MIRDRSAKLDRDPMSLCVSNGVAIGPFILGRDRTPEDVIRLLTCDYLQLHT